MMTTKAACFANVGHGNFPVASEHLGARPYGHRRGHGALGDRLGSGIEDDWGFGQRDAFPFGVAGRRYFRNSRGSFRR